MGVLVPVDETTFDILEEVLEEDAKFFIMAGVGAGVETGHAGDGISDVGAAGDVGVECFAKGGSVTESKCFLDGAMDGGIIVHGRAHGGFDDIEDLGVDWVAKRMIMFEAV